MKVQDKQQIRERVERSFTYHAPKDGQPERYVAIRDKLKEAALLIVELTPVSREQSLAITDLEAAGMWANKAIAVGE